MSHSSEENQAASHFRGIVEEFNDRAGYGYIKAVPDPKLSTDDLLVVHRHSLRTRSSILRAGDRVCFAVEVVPRGLLATDVHLDPLQEKEAEDDITAGPEASVEAREILSKAILARDSRKYEEAAALYEKGLKECPTVQMVLSYAAMEKNRRRREKAARIYSEGIRRFDQNAKLREDAGVLAASLGKYTDAIQLLEQALPLTKATKQGTKGVLLHLARTHYRLGNIPALKNAVAYYGQALKYGHSSIPSADLLQLNLARIRTQHHRGDLAVKFFERAGFRISRANLFEQQTEGADFLVQQVKFPELIESYSLAGDLLVRCYFKAIVTPADLKALDNTLAQWGKSDLIDDQAAFVVVASLPDEMQRILAGRIEQKNQPLAAVIPVPQADIETGPSAVDVLRNILERWLYRRDLFAGNRPVVGRRFFGRDKSLAELRDAVSSSVSAGVFGLRKVGKTSLLQESRRRSIELGDIVVYLDLLRLPADVTDCRWLYWKIADTLKQDVDAMFGRQQSLREFRWRVGGHFEDYPAIPQDFAVATGFDSDLSRLLKLLRYIPVSPKPKIILLLDEVERLLPSALGKSDFTGFFDFFSYLRGISQENDNFVIIVTGANAAVTEAPQFEGRDNPVFNFFKEVYLPHLESLECGKMIRVLGRGMGLRFSDAALDLIYQLTGGHPFFARRLCSFIAETYPERPLDVDGQMVTALLESYLDQRSTDFSEIIERLKRDYPHELAVCLALAKAGGSLPIHQVREMAGPAGSMRHLTGYQIVRTTSTTASLSMKLLTMWLLKRID
jgi:cold shock CspA family protein